MTDFAELSLANPLRRADSEDASILSGANELFKQEQVLNALFKEEQILPAGTAHAATKTTGGVDPLMFKLKMLPSSGTDHDAPEPITRSDSCKSALLLQLRVSVTKASAGALWYRTQETTTSNKSNPLNSAAAWNALSRRFQAANLVVLPRYPAMVRSSRPLGGMSGNRRARARSQQEWPRC
ncbi:hypothetical protein T484DRAFT_1901459 [Baffinella frigidus]|nr:hypothetical protein T484DRAFT_1901459 [Cryptophyta sp. CCMP2293]